MTADPDLADRLAFADTEEGREKARTEIANTPQQQARDMLTQMECVRIDGFDDEDRAWWIDAADFSSGEVAELASLIAENRRLAKRIEELEGKLLDIGYDLMDRGDF